MWYMYVYFYFDFIQNILYFLVRLFEYVCFVRVSLYLFEVVFGFQEYIVKQFISLVMCGVGFYVIKKGKQKLLVVIEDMECFKV